ncbi:MAG: hypothetical protein ONB48_17440 [candidate division KSB1 bacterium]|nr:hypothetical protein [candidate division KSB1 bacterium]MDZ7275264.1 hypothetical protein [candidate division KSB1 bacterium]MDZ7287432.1 hypothetical protein [candidate division KSB1 bacterium]MDZ7299546.1 hypothetical protein [candidate division KSB1 bacterium]MDZ7309093.1 hypothetical protein [candidate division KSB1 bacterium]
MFKKIGKLLAGVFALLLLYNCSSKPVIPPVTGYERYQNPYFKGTFSYPAGWHIVEEGGKVNIYSSNDPDVIDKFYNPTSKTGKDGALLSVSYQRLDTLQALEQYANSFKQDRETEGFQIKSVDDKIIDSTAAKQIVFSGAYDRETRKHVIHVMALKDSVLYTIEYAAFNDFFEPYRAAADTLLATLKLPTKRAAAAAADPSLPSAEFTEFANERLSLHHPDNFSANLLRPKAPVEFSLQLKGYRQDCTVQLDILPAQGLTVEKVFAQNEKFFKGRGQSTTTIDGNPAIYRNYSPMRGIESRVYFVVKNDKIYRIILNYDQTRRADFLPAFEKVVASLKIK